MITKKNKETVDITPTLGLTRSELKSRLGRVAYQSLTHDMKVVICQRYQKKHAANNSPWYGLNVQQLKSYLLRGNK
jgi:hypothetical protein